MDLLQLRLKSRWFRAVKRSGFIAVVLLALTVATTQPVCADEQLGFFPKDMAATVFDSEVKMLMPRMKDDQPELSTQPMAEEQATTQPAASLESEESKESALEADDTASLRERLSKKYGDPTEDPKIRIQADAPPPMKGMLEALDAGDEGLAYDYAQQYIKSLQRYQKVYGDVVSMTSAVMKSNNLAEGTQWLNVPTLNQHQALAATKRDEQVQKLLTLASQAQAVPSPAGAEQIFQSRNRKAIKAALSDRTDLPTNGNGSLSLIVFVDAKRPMLCSTLQEMMTLARKHGTDPKVSLLAATLGDSTELTTRIASNLPFPMRDGSALAQKLGVNATCSLALVSPEQKKAVLLSSPATVEFMDELISTLKGAPSV